MKYAIEKNSPAPLYKQLKRIIENQIKSGEKKPGGIICSEKEFCELYGISQITVRKAIFELVNEGALYRIQGKGTFVTDQGTNRAVATKVKTDNIAFLISREHHPIFSNTFYSYIFSGAEEEARARGYNVIYQVLDEKIMFGQAEFRLVEEKKVDGLLLVGEMPHNFIAELKRKDIPLVLIDHFIEDSGLDSIRTDNYKGAREMVDYLLSLGHSKIGFVATIVNHGTFMERFLGYKDRLGPKYDEAFVQTGLLWSGYGIMESMFRTSNVPTAIFTCNDHIALRAMSAIQQKGLVVPDDVSVAGFDDIDISSQTNPPLSTIRVQKEEMGRVGMGKLIERIKNSAKPAENIVLSTELVARKSCKVLEKT